jgi:PAN domain
MAPIKPGIGGNMPKAGRIAVWGAITGIALALQGCWEDDGRQLTLLGGGGCRTADGGEGVPATISVASVDECRSRCLGENGSCVAAEFNGNTNSCEIHSMPITTYEKVEGVACYAIR